MISRIQRITGNSNGIGVMVVTVANSAVVWSRAFAVHSKAVRNRFSLLVRLNHLFYNKERNTILDILTKLTIVFLHV